MNLDIENPDELLAYLEQTERITKGEQPNVTVLQGGVSNKTVLLSAKQNLGLSSRHCQNCAWKWTGSATPRESTVKP